MIIEPNASNVKDIQRGLGFILKGVLDLFVILIDSPHFLHRLLVMHPRAYNFKLDESQRE